MAPQNLTAPIIEAIKELNKKLEAKDEIIRNFQNQNASIYHELNDMKACVESICNNSSASKTSEIQQQPVNILSQNNPIHSANQRLSIIH